ncbi:MAG: hypothetical protein GKR98_06725 [Boseongicola sp.]|nr:MAG: hypothetical protein GKR98_06725 [Boseongicola sp.]
MGRLLLIFAIALGAYHLLSGPGGIRVSTGNGGGAIGGYSSSSSSAIQGVKNAAGGIVN